MNRTCWILSMLLLGCSGGSGDEDRSAAASDGGGEDSSTAVDDESVPHYWRCECDVNGSGRTALVLTHAAGSPLYADTCDVDDPSRRLEEEGDWYAIARGDMHSCSCERSGDPSECTPCGHATHCEEKKMLEEKGRTIWPPVADGVLWNARCFITENGERGELLLFENDGCSAQPEGPGAYLDWLCTGQFTDGPGDPGFSADRSCECEISLPTSPRPCQTCSGESSCAMRIKGLPWYGEVP